MTIAGALLLSGNQVSARNVSGSGAKSPTKRIGIGVITMMPTGKKENVTDLKRRIGEFDDKRNDC